MLAKGSRRLVIDAAVARASGGEDAVYPTSKNCRDFLTAARTICHHIVMTPDISEEWNRHQSNFARRWRVSMEARKKVHHIEVTSQDKLYDKIECTTTSEKDCQAMFKDLHLIEAALSTDRIVISLDETARKLFSQTAQRVGELKSVMWVNPDKTEDRAIDWLEAGAKPDKNRQIGFGEDQGSIARQISSTEGAHQ